MPSDRNITDDEAATFVAILHLFEEVKDSRCIPLLINSVSKDTGLGMYEHIEFVLMRYPASEVAPHLRTALKQGNDGVKYRCCWWACALGAWQLDGTIAPLMEHTDVDIRDAAAAFMELRSNRAEPWARGYK